MKILLAILLLSASAIGQEGIPVNIGTGKFPTGLDGVTELDAIQKSRIDALKKCVALQKSHYEQVPSDTRILNAAQLELTMAQLDATKDKQERLDFIQEALVASLETWQWIHELQLVGKGSAYKEALARAEVFRYRAMWLKENAGENPPKGLLGQPTAGKAGIPTKIGTGKFPPGLVGVAELDEIQKSRIDALKQCVIGQNKYYEMGLGNMNFFPPAQMELLIAQLDSTKVKEKRLECIQEAFVDALGAWHRIHELRTLGKGDVANEALAKATVLRLSAMWLKENNGEKPPRVLLEQAAVGQDGIPIRIGTGIPSGLVAATKLDEIQKSRIDALKEYMNVQQILFEAGQRGISLNEIAATQMELLMTQLETTIDKQKRLDLIQEAFVAALETWQRMHESQAAGKGFGLDEMRARAAVFGYRLMWLKERVERASQTIPGTYNQTDNCLQNTDGVMIIDIDQINRLSEFALISDSVTSPKLIKKKSIHVYCRFSRFFDRGDRRCRTRNYVRL